MKNEKLIKFNNTLKTKFGKAARSARRVAKISIAEDRKTMHVVSFWVLTAVMCLVSIIAVVYESKILPDRVNYDSYSDTVYYVKDEWIEQVKTDKANSENSLAESNMRDTSREALKATIKDMEKQIELLTYLKDNNVGLRLKEVESYDADYVYYIDGYAYRFDDISFTVGANPLAMESGDRYQILSDERSGDSIFEANLIFYFVAVLLVVLSFSDEFATGTIKLVVSKPVTRWQIGTAKLFSISTMLTFSWACSALLYTIIAACVKNPVQYVSFAGGTLSTIPTMAFNLLIFIDILLVSLGFIAVSMFFAVRFKNNIVAVILPFIVYFFKGLVAKTVPNLAVIDLFENLKLLEHFVLGNAVYGSTKLWQALLTSLGIMLLLMTLAIRRFKRYDMDKLK